MGTIQADGLITLIARLERLSPDDLHTLCKVFDIKGHTVPAKSPVSELIKTLFPHRVEIYCSTDRELERLVITANFGRYSVELDAYNGLYYFQKYFEEGIYDDIKL